MPTAPAKKPAAKKAAPAKKAAAKKPAPAPAPVAERRALSVWYIGNFEPPHSTENHVARAMRNQGWAVEAVQESDPTCWFKATEGLDGGARPDFILWTRTNWGRNDQAAQFRFLLAANHHGVPVVGYHLDIWWGLQREEEVRTEPFFSVDLLITADGGHDDRWAEIGANHLWFPPAVSAAEAQVGQRRDEFASRIAFVGSHDGGYHREHEHRHELIAWLKSNFGRSGDNAVRFWPEPGQHAIRGRDLQDLYASVDVVVGDSAFAGTGLARYVSDRLPETTGRGGFLLLPEIEGITDGSEWRPGERVWTAGEHIVTWNAGDWEALGGTIEWALSNPGDRREIATAGRQHTVGHHTYEVRAGQLVEALAARGLLRG